MDKVQKLNSNECYTPSSEPFRMYLEKQVVRAWDKFIRFRRGYGGSLVSTQSANEELCWWELKS
jgi:hypothetical protein